MNDLNRRALVGLARFLLTLAALLFLPAWTLDYWQAWVFLAVYAVCVFAITLYLMKNDPKLLERRMKAGPGAEKEKSQQILLFIALMAFTGLIVVPALDHRFGWSKVPWPIVVAGDVLIVLGFLVVFCVFKENTFTSATIEHDPEQKVVSTGPYALIRHPMYAGALVMLFGIPLALGSWRGLLLMIPLTLTIIGRLRDEERFLVKNLPGYAEYRNRVRYRLAPYLW